MPTTTPTIMLHRRRASASQFGPARSCQTLVTSEGTTSRAAASTGAKTSDSKPMAMVGKPMPITPLTRPASRNTRPANNQEKGRPSMAGA